MMTKKTYAKVGAPFKYNRKEILNRVKVEMAKGTRNLDTICEDEGMPCVESIYLWITEETKEAEELFKIFTHAQELWCWAQKEIIIKIADDDSRDILEDVRHIEKEDGSIQELVTRKSDNTAVNRDKLRVTTRQWAMNKLAAKHFGDKVTQEITGQDGGPIQYASIVDKPPKETMEEWQARVQKEQTERAKQVVE